MRRDFALVWFCVAAAAGCASAGSLNTQQNAAFVTEGPSCKVPVPDSGGETWREVRATRFTFCVPASWRGTGGAAGGAVDARTWRGSGGSITWGTGQAGSRRTVTTEVIVRPGEPLPTPSGQVRRFREVIDGRPAQFYDNEFAGKHYTGASWTRPAVYLEGEADNPAAARLQLAVYRTVRFTINEP